MLQRLFHVNICVRRMDRSVPFYEALGFKTIDEFEVDDPRICASLGFDSGKFRVTFMRLGDDPQAPILDLVQFIDPPAQGEPYPTLNNIGIPRIAFTVDDIDKSYEQLQTMGVEFVAPLTTFETFAGDPGALVCFKDPDGTVLELISGF